MTERLPPNPGTVLGIISKDQVGAGPGLSFEEEAAIAKYTSSEVAGSDWLAGQQQHIQAMSANVGNMTPLPPDTPPLAIPEIIKMESLPASRQAEICRQIEDVKQTTAGLAVKIPEWTISQEDKQNYIQMILGGVFKKRYSLFGGRIIAVFRNLKVGEINNLHGLLRDCILDDKEQAQWYFDNKMGLSYVPEESTPLEWNECADDVRLALADAFTDFEDLLAELREKAQDESFFGQIGT